MSSKAFKMDSLSFLSSSPMFASVSFADVLSLLPESKSIREGNVVVDVGDVVGDVVVSGRGSVQNKRKGENGKREKR
jgi:hypothetical protein